MVERQMQYRQALAGAVTAWALGLGLGAPAQAEAPAPPNPLVMPEVLQGSALSAEGVAEFWAAVKDFEAKRRARGDFDARRRHQRRAEHEAKKVQKQDTAGHHGRLPN